VIRAAAGSSGGSGSTRGRGRAFEELAARYLEGAGLEIRERNVVHAGAELDLVAFDPLREEFVFVEVRARADDRAGDPLETIGPAKRAQVRRAATGWLLAHGLWEKAAVRFDVVGIVERTHETPRIEWIREAFEETE
jgi:putative endonuclease